MKMKRALAILACFIAFTACRTGSTDADNTARPAPIKTMASAPLPDEALKVVLYLSKVPTTIGVGEQRVLQLKVRNAGGAVWPALGAEDGKFWVKLGDRWLDEKTEKVLMDDGRSLLPNDVAPGEEVEMPLIVTAPKKPGDYILEIGMLQEHVAWFQEKGASAVKIKVAVK